MPGEDFSSEDFSDLEGLTVDSTDTATPSPATPPKGKRMRATKDMISLSYRLKHFWKNAGIEMLLVFLLFFSLRHIVTTDTHNPESRALISTAVRLTQGKLDLQQITKQKSELHSKTAYAHSITLPVAGLTLLGAERNTFLVFSTIIALFSLLLVYNIGKLLLSAEAGILAAAIFTLLPGFLFHASGFYSLNFCFFYFSLSLLLFIKAQASQKVITFLSAGFLAAAACYANSWGLFLLTAFPAALFAAKKTTKKTLLFPLGILAFILVANLIQIILLKGNPLQEFSTLFHWQRISMATQQCDNILVNIGRVFQLLFANTTLIPFSLLSLIAVGYTIRSGSTNFPYLPMLFFGILFLCLEFFPISLTPYTTITKTAGIIHLFAPAMALLLGVSIASITNREAIRWLLGTATIITLPMLLIL